MIVLQVKLLGCQIGASYGIRAAAAADAGNTTGRLFSSPHLLLPAYLLNQSTLRFEFVPQAATTSRDQLKATEQRKQQQQQQQQPSTATPHSSSKQQLVVRGEEPTIAAAEATLAL